MRSWSKRAFNLDYFVDIDVMHVLNLYAGIDLTPSKLHATTWPTHRPRQPLQQS